MTTAEFKRQAAIVGLDVRKQKGLEVYEVSENGTELFTVAWVELYPLTELREVLDKKLRPEYIPPMG